MKNILGCTHYVEDGQAQRGIGTKMVHAFAIEACETCGNPAQAANAIGLSLADCRAHGLQRVQRRFPEQFYDEDTQQCRCDNCPEQEERTVQHSVLITVEVSSEAVAADCREEFEEAARSYLENELGDFWLEYGGGHDSQCDGGTPWIDQGPEEGEKHRDEVIALRDAELARLTAEVAELREVLKNITNAVAFFSKPVR